MAHQILFGQKSRTFKQSRNALELYDLFPREQLELTLACGLPLGASRKLNDPIVDNIGTKRAHF